MAVNKNFVVKNGLEVNSNLILADVNANAVGIGTSNIDYKLHVVGGIGATDLVVTGVSTFPYVHLTGTVSAGASLGASGQFLTNTGTGVTWANIPNTRSSTTFTATASQTSFAFNYTVGLIDVFINGVRLSTTEYIATDGIEVVLNQPCFGGETVDLISYSTINVGYAFTGIYGVSVSEEGSYVGTPGQITSIDFVGAAVTAVGSGAGVTVYITDSSGIAGIATTGTSYFNQLNVSGVSTFGGDVKLGYNDVLTFGDGNEFFIYRYSGLPSDKTVLYNTTGQINITSVQGLTIDNSSYNIAIFSSSETALYHGANNPVVTIRYNTTSTGTDFYKDITVRNVSGTEYFVVKTGGGSYAANQTLVGIGTTNPTSTLTVGGTLNIAGVSTFKGNLNTNGSNIKLGDGSEVTGNQIKLGNGVSPDSFGDSADLWIYHNSTANLFQDITGTGIRFLTNDFRVRHESANADTILTNTTGNNEVKLYQGGNLKFETLGAGVTVTGTTFTNNLSVSGVTTSVGGFTSGIGVTDPVQITVSGNVLTFTVAGVGSTSLTLY